MPHQAAIWAGFTPAYTVPEFEHAMNALKDGEISGPVQSPFGWHLIQAIEHRSQDMSKERQRQSARQAIRARKADAAFQEWLQRLRDRAYVEIGWRKVRTTTPLNPLACAGVGSRAKPLPWPVIISISIAGPEVLPPP